MARVQLVSAIVVTVCVGLVAGGSYCTFTKYSDDYPYNSYQYYTYCAYDCCTTDCCYNPVYTPGLTVSVWIIVVSVISSVVVISLIIACICCCIRKQATQGQVIRYTAPANTGQVSVVSSVSAINITNNQLSGPSGGQNGQPFALQPQGPPPYSLQAPVSSRGESPASPPYPPR